MQAVLTPHFSGVSIVGDYYDLYNLQSAVETVMLSATPQKGAPKATADELFMGERLADLSAAIREALESSEAMVAAPSHGQAEPLSSMERFDPRTGEFSAPSGEGAAPEVSVLFHFEVLVPEILYDLLALSYLVQYRRVQLAGDNHYNAAYPLVDRGRFDVASLRIMLFQGLVVEAFSRHLAKRTVTRITRALSTDYHAVPSLYPQWVDLLIREYYDTEATKRLSAVAQVVESLTRFYDDNQYLLMKLDIDDFAREEGLSRDRIRLEDAIYLTEVEW